MSRGCLEQFGREDLRFGPSPLHRLERLSDHLGGHVEIWARREDVNSPLAYGGNKVRKLEYLAYEARQSGRDTLVSIGGCNRSTLVKWRRWRRFQYCPAGKHWSW